MIINVPCGNGTVPGKASILIYTYNCYYELFIVGGEVDGQVFC